MNLATIKKCFILLLIIFTGHMPAMNLIVLTEQEKRFLKKHPTITLGTDSGWAPYVIKDFNGQLSGYDVDVLTLINQISGANFVLQTGKWTTLTDKQKNRKIDGLSTAAVNAERATHSQFSNSYISLEKIVFTRKDFLSSVNSLADLNGNKFGVYEGNKVAKAFANTIENVQIIEFNTPDALIEGVTTGKADFMLGNAAMFYLLNKSGNPFLKPAIFLKEPPLELVFVIRSDFPEAISIINKSLNQIGQEQLLQLKRKWFSSEVSAPLYFTQQEKAYLQKKQQLSFCVDPEWMPFEHLKNGKHIGMSADYFDLFRRALPIPINLNPTKDWGQTIEFAKQRKCDLISLAMPTENRNTYLNFSDILLATPVVLATKPDITFIDNLANLTNKKIGIIKGYAFDEIIREKYPNIEIINVKNAKHGLQMVVNGELFGYVDALATVGYMFQTQFVGELKISGKFDETWKMSVAVRNDEPILLSIMNKLIQHIPEKKHQEIFNHYVSINYKQMFDYTQLWQIIFITLILFLLFFYRYHTVSSYNRRIKRHLTVIDNYVFTSSTKPNGDITEVSNALCKLTGYKESELVGKNHNIFRHPKTPATVYRSLWSALAKGETWQGELLNLKKNGSTYWANVKIAPTYYRNGTLRGYTSIQHDITDKKRLEKLSITDTLTQIPNRLFINNSFDSEFERCQRYNSHFSIILIDIDFFKQINDNYGHNIGDEVLINIATILKQNIRQLDLLGRWGGEEFLLICPETNQQQAAIVAEKIREIIEEFEFEGVPQITCSFGIAQSRDNDTKETMFHRADNALYRAKDAGRNQVKLEKN